MTPTVEQQAIIDHGDANLMVVALAGTGKTKTIEMKLNVLPREPVLYLAFNKRIVDDAMGRQKQAIKDKTEPPFPNTVIMKTLNSVGNQVLRTLVGKTTVDKTKSSDALKAILDRLKGEDRASARDAYFDILDAVGKAKALGYIPDGYFKQAKRLITREQFHASLHKKTSDLEREIIDSILVQSIKDTFKGRIDFDDQVYMPALFGGSFPRFPYVVVDEVQDLNPVNHEMLYKLAKDWFGAVGDPWQSIYGFRGAVSGGIQRLEKNFSMQRKTLSISFRCPRAIVEHVRWRVPEFKWIRDGGSVAVLPSLSPSLIPDTAAILCRNNAPLLQIAYNLLAAKRSVSLEGSGIGPRLIRIMRKLGNGNLSQADLLIAIEAWKQDKLIETNAPKTICDMAECMKVFASWGKTLDQAIAYADLLLKQRGAIKLSTGHKAKGLEWDTVYHLDPWLIGEGEQELNLRYVISTRAKERLYEIDSKHINWRH